VKAIKMAVRSKKRSSVISGKNWGDALICPLPRVTPTLVTPLGREVQGGREGRDSREEGRGQKGMGGDRTPNSSTNKTVVLNIIQIKLYLVEHKTCEPSSLKALLCQRSRSRVKVKGQDQGSKVEGHRSRSKVKVKGRGSRSRVKLKGDRNLATFMRHRNTHFCQVILISGLEFFP